GETQADGSASGCDRWPSRPLAVTEARAGSGLAQRSDGTRPERQNAHTPTEGGGDGWRGTKPPPTIPKQPDHNANENRPPHPNPNNQPTRRPLPSPHPPPGRKEARPRNEEAEPPPATKPHPPTQPPQQTPPAEAQQPELPRRQPEATAPPAPTTHAAPG